MEEGRWEKDTLCDYMNIYIYIIIDGTITIIALIRDTYDTDEFCMAHHLHRKCKTNLCGWRSAGFPFVSQL